jgi:hypothetical protein
MTITTLHLSESSTVLDLYYQCQPDLEDVNFQVLADLAEVAEKYEVYSATAVCNLGEWAMALHGRYSSLQGTGFSLLKYRWCYESVQNCGTKLEQNACSIGELICR